MYESYFGFKDTPFRLSADENFRYAHKNYLRASAYLAYALEQGEGFVMITGHPGSGKTTLIRDVISELDESSYNVLNIVTSQLHAEELLRKVALEYELPAENASKATLLTTIHKHLSTLHEQGKQSILFLDEAQNLSPTGLEELRLLSNLQQGKHSLLQIVLVGHTELRQLVLGPDMQHVQQRLVASCQIDSLDQEQTREYIIHRLKHVDWQGDPEMEAGVFHLIHLASKGVPRNINHLMSHLLLFASLEEKHQLSDEDALTVIEELIDQQRITLSEDESFESFANRYREQKQQQVRQHAVAAASVYPLTPSENGSWHHHQQENTNPPPLNVSKLHAPANEESKPLDGAGLESPDSDWLQWREGADEVDIETQPVDEVIQPNSRQPALNRQADATANLLEDPADPMLPDADDIWNGTLESEDMETLFPDNRREKSTFSVEAPEDEPISEPIEEPVPENPEERWGGVWFMSSVNSSDQQGGGRHRRVATIKDSPLQSASTQQQNHNITVDENLTVPSVWVDGCPEIAATEPDQFHQRPRKTDKARLLKRSIVNIIVLISIGLVAMLALKHFPDQFNSFLHDNNTVNNRLDNAVEDTSIPPKSIDVQDKTQTPSNPPPSKAKPNIKPNTENSQTAVPQLLLPVQRDIVTEKVTPLQTKTVNTTATVETAPQESQESDIESYHHIELATRYFVYFDFNDFSIPAEHNSLLKSIRDKMLLEENNYLKITGYADSQGNRNYNLRLSLKRAEAVKEFFTLRGITDERLKVSAVGAVSNGNPKYESIDKRRLIRRVEVILFPK